MSIDRLDASIGSWDEELRVDEFLYSKDDAILDSETDRGAKWHGV